MAEETIRVHKQFRGVLILLGVLAALQATTFWIVYQTTQQQIVSLNTELYTRVSRDLMGLLHLLDAEVQRGVLELEEAQEVFRTHVLGPKTADGTRDTSQTHMAIEPGMEIWAWAFSGKEQPGLLVMNDLPMEGRNFWDYEVNGRQVVRETLGNVDKVGQVVRETWQDPYPGSSPITLIGYQDYFKPWDWIVTVGGTEEIIYPIRLRALKWQFGGIAGVFVLTVTCFLLFYRRAETDRRRRERERKRLATVVEQATEAIAIAAPDGTIQYVNPAFETMTGYRQAEALGRDLVFVNLEDAQSGLLAELRGAVTRGEGWAGHLSGRRKDGEPFEEVCLICPIRDEKGRLSSCVALSRDVTEQVRLERQLRQAQKLESLGTLAGGIAHDFNNILTPVIGFAELLLDGIDGPVNDEQRHDLERIVAAGARAQDLIRQILAFSREVEQPRQPVHLAPIIKETLKLMKASLPATVEVRQSIEAERDTVVADPTRIHQVLVNLCTNAGLAMEGQPGVLEVELAEFMVDHDLAGRDAELEVGRYLRLTVRDTGHGMPRDVLEHVFEPFFTTRGDRGGTGLGLSVVHGIVKGFGGAVRAYSEPGQGSEFRVYLPGVESGDVSAEEMPRPIPTGTEHVLFVDDEESILEMAEKMLSRMGYTVTVAASGEEALQALQRYGTALDIMITDESMPRMTGTSLIGKVRQQMPDLPVILTSGFSRRFSDPELQHHGIARVLPKPISMRELAEAIRAALAQSFAQRFQADR